MILFVEAVGADVGLVPSKGPFVSKLGVLWSIQGGTLSSPRRMQVRDQESLVLFRQARLPALAGLGPFVLRLSDAGPDGPGDRERGSGPRQKSCVIFTRHTSCEVLAEQALGPDGHPDVRVCSPDCGTVLASS